MILTAAADPSGVLPYLTGAGGAVASLALANYLWLRGRVFSSSTVEALRQADRARFDDLKKQLDAALAALEKANAAANRNAETSRASLALLSDIHRGGHPDVQA